MLEFYIYCLAAGYSFSSWPHSDITSLGHSATCTFLGLPFFTVEMFWDRIFITVQTGVQTLHLISMAKAIATHKRLLTLPKKL